MRLWIDWAFLKKKSEYLDTLTQAGGALPNKLNKKIVEYSKKNKIVFFQCMDKPKQQLEFRI